MGVARWVVGVVNNAFTQATEAESVVLSMGRSA